MANLLSTFKYILQSASYGVVLAIMLLLLLPGLREQTSIGSWLKPQTLESKPLSYANAVNKAAPAVVNIYRYDIEQIPNLNRQGPSITRLGSGVIMDSQGYILTNFHVVKDADLIQVLLQNGQQFPAQLVGYDVPTDLALLRVNAQNLPVIPQRKDMLSHPGDVVLAIGNPLNLGQTITQGVISGTNRNSGGISGVNGTNYLELLQMDAAINEGNSGGALVNTNGELVGINSRKFTQLNPQFNIQGIFFAVPYQLAYKVMQSIIEQGRVVRGWLGVSARNHDLNKGFIIDGVSPDSPAEKAQLKPGDIVYKISGKKVEGISQALELVADTPPNTELSFEVYRNNEMLTVPVMITEYKGL